MMNQQIAVRRDTVKTIRRRVFDTLGIEPQMSNNPINDSNLLVVNHSTTEASTTNAFFKIVAQQNPNGEMSYLYLNSDNDTIMVDKLSIDEATDSVPMTNTFYPSDTIKPSDYQFGDMSRAIVHYPAKTENVVEHKMTNDDVAQVVYLPLLVLITIGYLHRCITNGAWSRLGSELKTAWVS